MSVNQGRIAGGFWGLVEQKGPWKTTSNDAARSHRSQPSKKTGGGIQIGGTKNAGHAGWYASINPQVDPNVLPRPPRPSQYVQKSIITPSTMMPKTPKGTILRNAPTETMRLDPSGVQKAGHNYVPHFQYSGEEAPRVNETPSLMGESSISSDALNETVDTTFSRPDPDVLSEPTPSEDEFNEQLYQDWRAQHIVARPPQEDLGVQTSPAVETMETSTSGSTQYDTPNSGSTQYGTPTSGSTQYGTPTSGSTQYDTPNSGSTQYGTPTSGSRPNRPPPLDMRNIYPSIPSIPTTPSPYDPLTPSVVYPSIPSPYASTPRTSTTTNVSTVRTSPSGSEYVPSEEFSPVMPRPSLPRNTTRPSYAELSSEGSPRESSSSYAPSPSNSVSSLGSFVNNFNNLMIDAQSVLSSRPEDTEMGLALPNGGKRKRRGSMSSTQGNPRQKNEPPQIKTKIQEVTRFLTRAYLIKDEAERKMALYRGNTYYRNRYNDEEIIKNTLERQIAQAQTVLRNLRSLNE